MTAMAGQQSIGDSGNFYFELLIKASLNIRPATNNATQTLDFFNQLADISLGLKTLEGCITQPFNTAPKSEFLNFRQLNFPCPMLWHYCSWKRKFIAILNTSKLSKRLNKNPKTVVFFR
jgi:hypothetical protein